MNNNIVLFKQYMSNFLKPILKRKAEPCFENNKDKKLWFSVHILTTNYFSKEFFLFERFVKQSNFFNLSLVKF